MSDDIYEHIIYDEFNFYTPAQNNKIFDEPNYKWCEQILRNDWLEDWLWWSEK